MKNLIHLTANGKKIFAWSRCVIPFSFALLSLAILGKPTFLWAIALFAIELKIDAKARDYIFKNNNAVSILLYFASFLLLIIAFASNNYLFPIWAGAIFALALISKKIL